MSAAATGELSLSYGQKMILAEWVVKAGDTALDYLFMTYLPLPFLAGHSLLLALRSLPAPLRDAYPPPKTLSHLPFHLITSLHLHLSTCICHWAG